MDHFKTVVMDYLQSDKAVFVNAECCLQLDPLADSERHGQSCSCDAVAIDLRHRAVYLCHAAFEHKLHAFIEELYVWTRNWDSIKASLQRDCGVPANWRVYVWLFVPKDSIEMADEKLEQLRQTIGSKFKVKITALEDAQPWRASTWKHCEVAAETNGSES